MKEIKTNKNNNVFFNELKKFNNFYNKEIRRKHLIFFIIALIIFFLSLNIIMSNNEIKNIVEQLNTQNVLQNTSLIKSILKDGLLFTFIIILAGITPYLFLSVIGIGIAYTYASQIGYCLMSASGTNNVMLLSIGSVISIFGTSLAIAVGIKYCLISTKKFKYSQTVGFSFKDVQKGIYEITKNEEKLLKLEQKNIQKQEKIEKLNVKVPYKMFIYSYIISATISIIGILIARI